MGAKRSETSGAWRGVSGDRDKDLVHFSTQHSKSATKWERGHTARIELKAKKTWLVVRGLWRQIQKVQMCDDTSEGCQTENHRQIVRGALATCEELEPKGDSQPHRSH